MYALFLVLKPPTPNSLKLVNSQNYLIIDFLSLKLLHQKIFC